MRLKTLSGLAMLALAVGLPSAVASPLAQTGGATTAAPSDIQLVQDERRRDRRRGRRDDNSRGGGDGVYTGGRGGDRVYTGGNRSRGDDVYRGGNQGTVFCNPTLGCVRDLNTTPGVGLGR